MVSHSAAIMTVQCNSMKKKRMIGPVYNLFESSLRITQHVTVSLRLVDSSVLTRRSIHILLGQKNQKRKRKLEHKATFLDPLKGMQTARKYMNPFHTRNIIIVT
jgi:hypothetical protein